MISGRNRLTRGLAALLATQRGYQTPALVTEIAISKGFAACG